VSERETCDWCDGSGCVTCSQRSGRRRAVLRDLDWRSAEDVEPASEA